MSLIPVFVKLTQNQKNKLIRGYKKREPVNLKLQFSNENEGNRIYVTKIQYNKITKGLKPVVITFNERHYKSIDKDTKNGGSLLSSLLPTLGKIATKTMPIIKKIAGPITSGIASALGSLGIEKIFGSGANFHNSKIGDIVKALAIVQNEITKLPKKEKEKFDKVMMMSGNGQMEGGFLSAILGALGIPMILKLLGSGLHNDPVSGFKTHPKKIPIAQNQNQNQPIIKNSEGTSLEYKWLPYEPQFDDHEIIGVKGYGIKKRSKKKTHGQGILFGNSKNNPFRNVPLLNLIF